MRVAPSPFGKVRKQVVQASNEARTGVMVLNGGEAELHFEFGVPARAVLVTEDGTLFGLEAIQTLTKQVQPPVKIVWMDPLVGDYNLDCSADELAQMITDPVVQEAAPREVKKREHTRKEDARLKGFFPLLPEGKALVASTPIDILPLRDLLNSLPTSLLVLTDEGVRGALVIRDGRVIDALWVSQEIREVGRAAVVSLLEKGGGLVSVYTLDDALIPAISALWRMPVKYDELEAGWLNIDNFVEDLTHRGGNRALLVRSHDQRGVILVVDGALRCAYTSLNPEPEGGAESVVALAKTDPRSVITVLDGTFTLDTEIEADFFHEKANEAIFTPQAVEREAPEALSGLGTDNDADELGFPWPLDGIEPLELVQPADKATHEDPGIDEIQEEVALTDSPEETVEPSPVPDPPAEAGDAISPSSESSAGDGFTFLFGGSQVRGEGAGVEEVISPLLEEEETDGADAFVSQISVNWDDLIRNLTQLSINFLGEDAGATVASKLRQAERTPTGMRSAIFLLNKLQLPGVTEDAMKACVHTLLYEAAEACTGA